MTLFACQGVGSEELRLTPRANIDGEVKCFEISVLQSNVKQAFFTHEQDRKVP
jgi:hypothetical protein